MDKYNILVCLEGLGIGGVETAVINQVLKLKSMGNQVIVLAREGIYNDLLEKNGIIHIQFDYEIKDNYCIQKSEIIIEIINKYKINQIHIHQFPCASYLLPVCLSCKIPYVLFLHTGQVDVYDWFINTYPIYNSIFPLLFKNASKIVSITEAAKEYTSKKFNVQEDKYIICNNGINFDLYEYEEKEEDAINKILLLSRFSAEKIESIKHAINLFIAMYAENKNMQLDIVGDGDKKEVIEEYILSFSEKYPIKLLGKSNEIPCLIKEHDMVMAMGRGIIEAVAMKRLAFVIGYTGLKGIVTPDNIDIFQEENFTGRNKNDITIEQALIQISSIEYEKIVENNYKYLFENLNIQSCVNKILGETLDYQENNIVLELFKEIENLKSHLEVSKNKLKQQEETIIKQSQEGSQKNARIQDLEKELFEVYNSKRWRYTDKISRIFNN